MITPLFAPHVYLLEGEVGGRPLRLPLFVGAWGALLLDTGCASHVEGLLRPAFRELALEPPRLRYVVNTHPDFDHVGGNAAVKRWAPGCLLACGDADRPLVESPERLYRERYDAYRTHGISYSEEVRRYIRAESGDAQPVDLTFVGGERLRLAPDWELEVVLLPGHSRGHLGLLDRRHRTLFGGDAVQGAVYLDRQGRPALCPTYLYPESYRQTIRFVRHLDLDRYCGCHWAVQRHPREIAEFCRESELFVRRAEELVRAEGASTQSLPELCRRLGPRLGDWPEAVHEELCYALAGHLGLQ